MLVHTSNLGFVEMKKYYKFEVCLGRSLRFCLKKTNKTKKWVEGLVKVLETLLSKLKYVCLMPNTVK
jgi:hypothetical protein